VGVGTTETVEVGIRVTACVGAGSNTGASSKAVYFVTRFMFVYLIHLPDE
jgi:hypothetical protein